MANEAKKGATVAVKVTDMLGEEVLVLSARHLHLAQVQVSGVSMGWW